MPEQAVPGKITRPGDYKRVYGSGRRIVGRYLILFCSGPGKEQLRVGITVSGKVGGSVVRNREKRRVREAVRREITGVISPADIVFVALGRIKTASFDELCSDMRALILRAKL